MQPPSLTAKPRKAAQTNKVCSYMFGNKGGGDEDVEGGLRKFLDTRKGGL